LNVEIEHAGSNKRAKQLVQIEMHESFTRQFLGALAGARESTPSANDAKYLGFDGVHAVHRRALEQRRSKAQRL